MTGIYVQNLRNYDVLEVSSVAGSTTKQQCNSNIRERHRKESSAN